MAREITKSRKCRNCSALWQSYTEEVLCTNCKCDLLFEGLPNDSKQEIDELVFGNEIMSGVEKIRDYLLISLTQSIELFTWRKTRLREQYPTLFIQTPDKYWDSFRS